MQHQKLRRLIFMALCCVFGLFTKRLIAPAANILTDSLHIPGGIGTAFSLLFLVVAAALIQRFGTASAMGAVQSVLALAMGMVGSISCVTLSQKTGYEAGILISLRNKQEEAP